MCFVTKKFGKFFNLTASNIFILTETTTLALLAHGVGRVVGVLGSEADFAGSMLN